MKKKAWLASRGLLFFLILVCFSFVVEGKKIVVQKQMQQQLLLLQLQLIVKEILSIFSNVLMLLLLGLKTAWRWE